MNIRRFQGRTSREALAKVRQALGDDAVVVSNRPSAQGGVEILAMAEGALGAHDAPVAAPVAQTARVDDAPARTDEPPAEIPVSRPGALASLLAARRAAAAGAAPAAESPSTATPVARAAPRRGSLFERIAARDRVEPSLDAPIAAGLGERQEPQGDFLPSADPVEPAATPVDEDVRTLGMSTLSFQDYVRERMLRRRQAEQEQAEQSSGDSLAERIAERARRSVAERAEEPVAAAMPLQAARPSDSLTTADDALDADGLADPGLPHDGMIDELRSVRSLIEQRFGMLAFMERMQRDPRQVQLAQQLLDAGFSPALVRKLSQGLPDDESAPESWAAAILTQNLQTAEGSRHAPIEDSQGIVALVGPTGVGKTTTCAKLAAAFAARHGVAQLGLITLDAYRVGAQEQLRAYGRILGVPVHTAHDRASLDDLLELLSGKRLVLIDTAGMAQRDARTRELLDMLSHPDIRKVLVLNAAAQGETLDDVVENYRIAQCEGVIVSKVDEAARLGPMLDTLIRHKAGVLGVANGQRVPEDWHHLSAQSLVQRALRGPDRRNPRFDADDVHLVLTATRGSAPARTLARPGAVKAAEAATGTVRPWVPPRAESSLAAPRGKAAPAALPTLGSAAALPVLPKAQPVHRVAPSRPALPELPAELPTLALPLPPARPLAARS